jgi:hypothetical protein
MEKKSFTTKLYEVCSTDELRPVMVCVHFKGGFAYASDGHMLVKQSLEYHTILNPELLDGKSLHMDNYKAIMGFEFAECNEDGIACHDSDGRTAFYDYFDLKGQEVPNFESVLKPCGQKSVEFIGMNPEYLYKISKAMHSPGGSFRLQFQGVDKPILIDTPEIENQWGILMPAIINDSLWSKNE